MTTSQVWNPVTYGRDADYVPQLGLPLVDLLHVGPGQRVLDVGCGDGVLSLELLRRGADVVGLDSSPELLDAARERGIVGLCGDAQKLQFQSEFDAVLSNAALHWVPDLPAVFRGAYEALRPGGVFVGEAGGFGNLAAICTALRAVAQSRKCEVVLPWYFRTAAEIRQTAVESGFEVGFVELFARPTPLPRGMTAWLDTFAAPILRQIGGTEALLVRRQVVDLLAPSLCSHEHWTADYVRVRFSLRKPVPKQV